VGSSAFIYLLSGDKGQTKSENPTAKLILLLFHQPLRSLYKIMSSSTNGFPADVIDWTEAMQQTGDDEEFLRELLADLKQETDTQLANIEQIIQVRALWRFVLCCCGPWTALCLPSPVVQIAVRVFHHSFLGGRRPV